MMQWMMEEDYEGMSRRAAGLLAAQVTLKPGCVLGLATGSTPVGVYRHLVEMHRQGQLDFARVRSVNLDEYKGLPPQNDQSYRYFMEKHLFSSVNIQAANTHVPNGMEADAARECARYDALIDEMGIDMQLLGLGHNGHIGFNEPADSFPAGTHPVALAESTIEANARFFEKADEVPREAYTMGIGSIMKAKRIVVVISGKDKAEIAARAFTGPITPQVPASVLQLHPCVTIVGDREALSAVPKEAMA